MCLPRVSPSNPWIGAYRWCTPFCPVDTVRHASCDWHFFVLACKDAFRCYWDIFNSGFRLPALIWHCPYMQLIAYWLHSSTLWKLVESGGLIKRWNLGHIALDAGSVGFMGLHGWQVKQLPLDCEGQLRAQHAWRAFFVLNVVKSACTEVPAKRTNSPLCKTGKQNKTGTKRLNTYAKDPVLSRCSGYLPWIYGGRASCVGCGFSTIEFVNREPHGALRGNSVSGGRWQVLILSFPAFHAGCRRPYPCLHFQQCSYWAASPWHVTIPPV